LKTAILVICAVGIVAALLMVGLALYLASASTGGLSRPPAHGVALIIEADFTQAAAGTNDSARLKEVVERRLKRQGLRAYYWEALSATRFRVMVPAPRAGAEGAVSMKFPFGAVAEQLRAAVSRAGLLEFRLVHQGSQALVERTEVPAGFQVVQLEETRGGVKTVENLVISKKAEPGLTGWVVKDAWSTRGASGGAEITFELRPDAAAAFARVTREHIGQRLAILLDGKVYSAPRIQSPIEGGRALIQGQFTQAEAASLADALSYPFPCPVTVVRLERQ
jgi:preprotein translocase subunit SecD